MKKTMLLSLFCFSSANAWTPPDGNISKSNSSENRTLSFLSPSPSYPTQPSSQFRTQAETISGNANQNFARLGDGYRTMATEFTVGTFFNNMKSSLVRSNSSYSISFQDDLTEEQLRREMGLKVSGTIPVEEVVVSPAVSFTRKAGKTRLSRTTTLIANAKLGTYKAVGNKQQAFEVSDSALYLFDENGVLKPDQIGTFYKLYGDSVVVSQELVGKLFVTAKLSFDSSNVLNEFTGKVGGSISSLLTGGSGDKKIIEVNVKLKTLSEDIKKRTSLTLVATQFGGVPHYLSELFDTPSTCSLANLAPCQTVIDKLNEYVSQSFTDQLNPQDSGTWYAESLIVAPYDSLNLVTRRGQHIYVENTLDPLNNIYLTDLVNKVSRIITKDVKNHNMALDMLRTDNLARNEYDQAENALYLSENNYQKMKGFATYCYSDLSYCFANHDDIINTLIKRYPTDLLRDNIGTLITSVASSYMPLPGQEHRSSDNFLKPESLLHSERYSNFYFKLKTVNNDLLTNTNMKFKVTCDIPWYRGYDKDILNDMFSGAVVQNNALHNTYVNLCDINDSIYIRDPLGFPYPGLIVEMWGRE